MLKIIWLFSLVAFSISITIPMFTIKQFYFLENEISLCSSILTLIENYEIILALILILFTILIPYYKFFLLFEIIFLKKLNEKKLHRSHSLNKWGMSDVYIIANLVVITKVAKLIDTQLHLGFYIFLTALLLNIFLTHYSRKPSKTR